MIGIGIGLTSLRRSGAWTPRKLGAAWVMDPAKFTLSGSAITRAADGGGGAISLAAVGGAEPTLSTAGRFTGKPSLVTTATTALISATGGVTGAQPFHIVLVAEMASLSSGFSTLANFGSLGAANNVGLGTSNQFFEFVGNGTSGTIDIPVAAPRFDTLPHIFELYYDGTNVVVSLDQDTGGASPIPKSYSITNATFGIVNWFAAYGTQLARIHSLAFGSNKNFTRSQVAQFLRYEMRRLGSTGKIVAMFGDSTTAGSAVGSISLAEAVRSRQAAPYAIFPANYGVSGNRPDQIATRLVAFAGAATHVTLWLGRNSTLTPVSPSVDAAAAYASVAQGVAAAHALGAKAVVGTLDQWPDSTTSSYTDNFRIALNTLIRANAAGADAIADVDALMGATNATYYADTIHLNALGMNTYVGPCFYTALLSV